MKGDGTGAARVKALLAAAGKYKYVLLVILAGVLLLLLPAPGKGGQGEAAQPAPEPFQVDAVERKLENALSQVEGTGKVTVVLTVKSTGRQILAQDGAASEQDGGTESTVTTVVVAKGSGVEETVSLQQLSPEFQGALVVCSGGGDPGVRLALVEAVSDLTGLGTDRITVCRGK